MFIEKIESFILKYQNIKSHDFLDILDVANTQNFNLFKLEKDFLLTLVLIRFWEIFPDLVFKWWTCLNKIYFPYFRLSEDLDFVISTDIWRTARQTLLKKYEHDISYELSKLWLTLKNERTKFDEHRLAMFTFEYISIINNSLQTIKLDISLKWELFLSPVDGKIQSHYTDKILEKPIFWEHTISCIDLREWLAEKIRAALTRKIPAIRDFFDIWYVRQYSDFDFQDWVFLDLIQKKLYEVNYKYTIDESYELLEKQVVTDLIPVIHEHHDFSLKDTYNFIMKFKK